MKRKPVLWLLVGALLIIVPLLVGCGEEAPTPAPAPPPPAPAPAPAPAPTGEPTAIPHTLEGRDDCLVCHETGVAEATVIPADHAGRTSDTCTACHQPAA